MRTRAARFGGLVCALHGNQAPITGGKSAVLHAFSHTLVNSSGPRGDASDTPERVDDAYWQWADFV